ncbi:hypothetical protein SK128_008283, partial [Halocaridina rubra]
CNLSIECEFMSQLEDTYYDTLQSRHFQGRYIAIATNGRIKRARRLRGPLGTEHFFLSRKVKLEEVHRIIERYHRHLGQQPPQRCAGYNAYNMTTSGIDEGIRLGGTVAVSPTPHVTVVPVTSLPATTPSKRCRIVKGRKRCRKHKKRCKTKKCRERRRRNKKKKQKKDRRKKGQVREEQNVTTVPTLTVTERENRDYIFRETDNRVVLNQQRHQYREGVQRRHRGSSTANSSSHLQGRRPRHQHLLSKPTSPSLTTPPSSHGTLRLSSNPRRPRLGTITTNPPLPFPSAPSSAHPFRIRHAHSARRQRRPRGPLKSPTSAAA